MLTWVDPQRRIPYAALQDAQRAGKIEGCVEGDDGLTIRRRGRQIWAHLSMEAHGLFNLHRALRCDAV